MSEDALYYKEKYEALAAQYAMLKHEMEQLKRLIYGAKSERFVPETPSEQLSLELAAEEKQAPVQLEAISYNRTKKEPKKPHPGRMPLPAHLPRVEEIIEPEEDVTGFKKIGEEVTESLEYTAGKFHVRKIVRPKYARPQGEGVVIGNLPSRAIEKGIAGASLLAYILISKYVDHLPLHRIGEIFKREGVNLPASTVSDWAKQAINKIEPLYEALDRKVRGSTYLQADETPIKVLDKDKKGKTHRGYYWVYHSPEERLVLFDYREGRGREGPEEILENFQGYLQTDGYDAYDAFAERKGVEVLHCMAHARRKFEEALSNDKARAEHVLKKMQELYAIERQAREAGLSHEERKKEREKAIPVLCALEEWMKEQYPHLQPKSAIGQAIAYSLKRWKKLSKYTENGRLEIDNNLVENAIRPVAIGRKNYLFAGSHDAARRAAMLYSLTASCKKNNVNPMEWLKDVLDNIDDYPISKIENLLPYNWIKLKSY